MSCMISRRNFMRCVGIGALALASGSLLGGCTQFDKEYLKGELVTWTDASGKTFKMQITKADSVTSDKSQNDLAERYQLKLDKGQKYIFLRFTVDNETGGTVDLYEQREGFFPFIKYDYTDDDIRNHFYTREEPADGDTDSYSSYPNANKIVEAPSVIWAYQNGNDMNRDSSLFGVICYTGDEGKPEKEHTFAKIPEGTSYIDCIGQVNDDFKVLRLVYRMMEKEVNFKLTSADFGL